VERPRRCFVLCKNAKYLKGKVYKTMNKDLYWCMERRPGQWQGERKGYWREQKGECCGGYLESHWRIRKLGHQKDDGVACITGKIREARLLWYGHVIRREDENYMKGIMTAEVSRCHSRGRQKKRWGDIIQQDMNSLRLKKEHTADRKKWRGRIRVTEPSSVRDLFKPEGNTENRGKRVRMG